MVTTVPATPAPQKPLPLHPAVRWMSPTASIRVQLFAAALMWLVGSSILLVRGSAYLDNLSWYLWILAAALLLGLAKAHLMLFQIANGAIRRIKDRGPAHFFGFFSLRSWLLVAVMMGGGIVLREAIPQSSAIGTSILGVVYLAVGTALLVADYIFWKAAVTS